MSRPMAEELAPRQREEWLLGHMPVLEAVVGCLRGPVGSWPEVAERHVRAVLGRLPRRKLLAIVAAIPSKERYAALATSDASHQRRLLRAMRRDPDMEFVLRFVADQAKPIARRLRKGMTEIYAFYLQVLAIGWAAATGADVSVRVTRRERKELARATIGGERIETMVRRVLGRLARKLAGAPAYAALAPVGASQVARVVRKKANGALRTAQKELRMLAEEFLFLAVRKALASEPRFLGRASDADRTFQQGSASGSRA